MLLHFLAPDTWMHRYGNSTWLNRWAIEQMDRLIGSVIQAYKNRGVWNKTATFIVSDHGFLNIK